MFPVYQRSKTYENAGVSAAEWIDVEEELVTIGTNEVNFSFDNERPAHKHYLYSYSIADRPVTNKEYIEFINDGGYETPSFWLAEGWEAVQKNNWNAPLYWEKHDGTWYQFTLSGLKEVRGNDPVTHVSYFEADAFARWAGSVCQVNKNGNGLFGMKNQMDNF
ncbi:SUMF1/EgtB/PvdO family nonheme iron enzyme [Alteribacillus sp. JSM 102045]|uniref:SUMF1/EgtB/PvdO family nonheme iron enzyme n=1 Tax=Alteribacillus sp. JSM 102045 TaxID=1562101 RepID=UPI0035C0E3F2